MIIKDNMKKLLYILFLLTFISFSIYASPQSDIEEDFYESDKNLETYATGIFPSFFDDEATPVYTSPPKKSKSESSASSSNSSTSHTFLPPNRSLPNLSSSYRFKEAEKKENVIGNHIYRGWWRKTLALRYKSKVISNKWHYEAGETLQSIQQEIKKEEVNISLGQITMLYTNRQGSFETVRYQPPYLFVSSTIKNITLYPENLQISCTQASNKASPAMKDIFYPLTLRSDPKRFCHAERAYLLSLLTCLDEALSHAKCAKLKNDSLTLMVFNQSSYYDPCGDCSKWIYSANHPEGPFFNVLKSYLRSKAIKLTDDFCVFFAISSIEKYGNSRTNVDVPYTCEYSSLIPLPQFLPYFAQMRLEMPALEFHQQLPPYLKTDNLLTNSQEEELGQVSVDDTLDPATYFNIVHSKAGDLEAAKSHIENRNPSLIDIAEANSSNDPEINNYRLHNFVKLYSRSFLDHDDVDRFPRPAIIHSLLSMLPINKYNEYTALIQYYYDYINDDDYFLEDIFSPRKSPIDKIKRDLYLANYLCTRPHMEDNRVISIVNMVKLFGLLFLKEPVTSHFQLPHEWKKLKKKTKEPLTQESKLIPNIINKIKTDFPNSEMANIASYFERTIGLGDRAHKKFETNPDGKYYFIGT